MTPIQDPAELIACPECDALHPARIPTAGERLACARCRRVLIAPRPAARCRIVALGLLSLALALPVLVLPFLSIRRFGLGHEATLADAAGVFPGPMLLLALAVLAAILLVPVARVALMLYVLLPLALGRRPWHGARRAFGWSEALRPWSMAEIFVLGSAVALVKVAGLAHVEIGPAFWALALLVVLLFLQDRLLCRWSLWRTLGR